MEISLFPMAFWGENHLLSARKVWGDVVITNRTRLFDNNRFPTTTFGNDDKQKSKKQKQMSSPRVSVGDLVVLQGNKSDEQQILDCDFPG